MNTENKTSLPDYMVWWNGLTKRDKKFLIQCHCPGYAITPYADKSAEIESIYKLLHTSPAEPIKEDTLYIDMANEYGQVLEDTADDEIMRYKQKGIDVVKDYSPLMFVTDEIDEDMENPCRLDNGYCWLISKEFSANPAEQSIEVDNSVKGFTKGEWNIGETSSGSCCIISENDKGIISIMAEWRKEAKANAQRIVTCVNNHDELVSALKDMMKKFESDYPSLTQNYSLHQPYMKAKAILTKINKPVNI